MGLHNSEVLSVLVQNPDSVEEGPSLIRGKVNASYERASPWSCDAPDPPKV